MTKFSKQWIQEGYNEGEQLDFVFFWGPGEAALPKACFNQWHPSKFVHNNFTFHNAEQAMMAEKAALFDDWGTLHQILECVQPRAVKALGRLVQGYHDETWARVRLQKIIEINISKFSQNPTMLQHLRETGQQTILVEASPVDKIWGIGMNDKHRDCRNPNLWLGTNLLGEALMNVRQRLWTHE